MLRKGGKDAKNTESVWTKIVSGKEAKCYIFFLKKICACRLWRNVVSARYAQQGCWGIYPSDT